MGLFGRIRNRVEGFLWGDVRPERVPPPPSELDARQHAIHALFDYLADVEFSLDENGDGKVRQFRIKRSNFLDEWPDDMKTLVFPSIAALPGEVTLTGRGFANDLDESTLDVFGKGTCVLPLHEHQEKIVLDVFATTRFQRAAVVAGLETAFDASEEMSGIRLRLPRYFGQVARYTLEKTEIVDDADSARRRRQAKLTVRMEVDVSRLVDVVEIRPRATATVVPRSRPLPPA
jgi:hypothetical protein